MSELSGTNEMQGRNGLRRRDFLALLPATVATLAASALPRAAFAEDLSPLGLDLKGGSPLSVGYIAGSDQWVERPDLPWEGAGVDHLVPFEIEVVPAERLLVGSELAHRPIELTVHGLVPGVPRAGSASWKSAYLFASLPAPPDLVFGPDPVPFLAWSARADGDPRQAAKVRPVLETGGDGSLYFGLEIRSGGKPRGGADFAPTAVPRGDAGIVLRTTNFTVDPIAGRPKLQEGVYLLAFAPGLWRKSWRGDVADLATVPGLESVAITVLALD